MGRAKVARRAPDRPKCSKKHTSQLPFACLKLRFSGKYLLSTGLWSVHSKYFPEKTKAQRQRKDTRNTQKEAREARQKADRTEKNEAPMAPNSKQTSQIIRLGILARRLPAECLQSSLGRARSFVQTWNIEKRRLTPPLLKKEDRGWGEGVEWKHVRSKGSAWGGFVRFGYWSGTETRNPEIQKTWDPQNQKSWKPEVLTISKNGKPETPEN